MKVRHMAWEALSASSPSALLEELAAWQEEAGEKEFVEMIYQVDGGTHYVLITYSE